jgi:hypothetical protein
VSLSTESLACFSDEDIRDMVLVLLRCELRVVCGGTSINRVDVKFARECRWCNEMQ